MNRHDDQIQAHCFTFDRPFCAGRFEGWLQLVMQLMGHNILRIKGIIHLKDHAGPMVIHGVQHIFHPPAWLAQWPEQDRQTKLVFITYDIDRATLAQYLCVIFTGSRAITTAAATPVVGNAGIDAGYNHGHLPAIKPPLTASMASNCAGKSRDSSNKLSPSASGHA